MSARQASHAMAHSAPNIGANPGEFGERIRFGIDLVNDETLLQRLKNERLLRPDKGEFNVGERRLGHGVP
jgi:hypothetical protein